MADTIRYSTFCELNKSELDEISDESINSAYNFFDAERMKFYHGIFVKTDRNFKRRKVEKPSEWYSFEAVVRICKKNNFHLRCYIKYCFINILAKKAKGRTLSDIDYLRNYPQVISYYRNKAEIERLYSIYLSINKSIFLVRRMSQRNGKTVKETIKDIISSGKLAEYIESGMISPFFLSLIRNITVIVQKYRSKEDDFTVLNDMCSRMENYGKSAMESMSMFFPSAANKTIVELCS